MAKNRVSISLLFLMAGLVFCWSNLNFIQTRIGNEVVSSRVLSAKSSGVIKGGIVPHHLMASDMIDNFFIRLSTYESINVVLVGPNHFELGSRKIIGCLADCEEFLEGVKVNEQLAVQLGRLNEFGFQKEIIQQEHSIMELLPYVKTNLPNARIIPLVISKKADLALLGEISDSINEFSVNNKTIMIASVDFSHYLSSSESEKMDQQSIEAIKNKDYSILKGFGSEHMDSPESLILLLMTIQKSGLDNMEMLGHTNSGILLQDLFTPVTSYYTVIYN